jgi:RNA polymerase sigma factor (sigma-70 family)
MAQESDDDILKALLQGGESEEKALRGMYLSLLPMVVQHITRNNGSRDDAMDVFQDALIVFTEHVHKGSFQRRSSISTYVMGIVRNAWNNRLRRKGYGDGYASEMKHLLEDEREPAPDVPDQMWMDQERENMIALLLSKLGDKCREILQKRFWEGLKMEQIAERMAYKNGQIAKNKHFRCLEELRELLRDNTNLRNHLRGML